MYELAIEHHRRGLTLSVHPDRRDAGDALAAYYSRADCVERILQMTEAFSSYELVRYDDRRPIAIATIEHRAADLTAEQHFAAAKAARDDNLAVASSEERCELHTAWDHITGAINHSAQLA
jgi:hypothetical protein